MNEVFFLNHEGRLMQSAIRSYVLLIMKCILLPFAYILTSDRGKTNIVRVGYLTAVQLLMVGLVG